jgi:hypothetical protein
MPIPNHNTHLIVKNISGTSGHKCYCRSWVEHWELATGKDANRCSVRGCTEGTIVGGHVQHTDKRTSSSWWIVPLCKHHNHYSNSEKMTLLKTAELVDATVSRTCSHKTWLY